jgi:exopolysaccharide biosynthesis polyprenyl glycosylphosphotransferase
MALVLVVFFFSQFTFFSRFIFGMAWISGLVLILGGRVSLRKGREFLHQKGFGKVGILILGTGTIARQAIILLKKNPKYKILGVLSEKKSLEQTFEKVKILGTFAHFESLIKKHHPDEVLIASETQKITSQLVRIAHIHHVKFRFLPDELGLDLAAVTVSTLGNLPLITLQHTKLGRWGYVIKSGIDIFIALIALILISPIGIVIAWKIWKEDRSAPIFYASRRVGKGGKEFLCLKFRTMIPNAEQKKKSLLQKNERKGDVLFKIKEDPRITALGKILRQWSLDELPQLLNVLKGDMSLIGPRPHLPEEVKKYPKDDLRVLSIKPGMTGFSQINGRSSLSFEEEMNYELFYIKNWSFRLDAIIFIKSIFVVFRKQNVS